MDSNFIYNQLPDDVCQAAKTIRDYVREKGLKNWAIMGLVDKTEIEAENKTLKNRCIVLTQALEWFSDEARYDQTVTRYAKGVLMDADCIVKDAEK